jgi:predicted short-subunit dehydrogenase-like oxidoreductase (DUF2520 family)
MTESRRERPKELPWIIAGAGRLGSALAWLFHQYQLPLLACSNRRHSLWEMPPNLGLWTWKELREFLAEKPAVVWLTIPDDALAEEARLLSKCLQSRSILLHTSGSRGSSILQHGTNGYGVGSLHPLLSIAEPKMSVEKLRDCGWTFEGSQSARIELKRLEDATGIRPHDVLPDRKSLYHAAAVTASGHLVALLDSAIVMAEEAGLEETVAKGMILKLAMSSLQNLEHMDPEDALTGPSARGDRQTIDRHVAVIKDSGLETFLSGYLALSSQSDGIATRRTVRNKVGSEN